MNEENPFQVVSPNLRTKDFVQLQHQNVYPSTFTYDSYNQVHNTKDNKGFKNIDVD